MSGASHSAATWREKPIERSRALGLARSLRVSPLLAQLLINRGISEAPEAQRFLEPGREPLSDPLAMAGMAEAVARLLQARDRGEQVLVFGDYDVDGIAGIAILSRAFRRFGIARCFHDMPHRVLDGYGLNPDRVHQAHRDGIDLIVTVDNGSSSHEAAALAESLGIDLIVTDHHHLEHGLPPAVAVVNPKRDDTAAPWADACGAAIAFKLACALTGEVHDLDLAALGTVADVVPLLGENRDIVAAGLQWAATHPRAGMQALAEIAKLQLSALKADEIAFQIAPRLNAAGRMGSGLRGVDLLLTDSPTEARRLARDLDRANEERRQVERGIFEEIEGIVQDTFSPAQRSIVLGCAGWHSGVLGIVAARVLARYNVPTILIAFDEDGIGRGSGRSGQGVHMAEALAACHDLLDSFGGHRAAGGITIREENLQAFRDQFNTAITEQIPEGPPPPELEVDAILALSEIDGALVRDLDRLRPFGHGNPAPIFSSYGVTVLPDGCREVGVGHLRLTLQEGPRMFQAIGFGMAGHLDAVQRRRSVDIAYTPEFNTWRGETSIQLRLIDLHTA